MSRRILRFPGFSHLQAPPVRRRSPAAAVLAACLGAASGLSVAGGCGDSSGTGGEGGEGVGASNAGRVCIDRTSLVGVPPAGLKIGFRVLDAYGDPVRPLNLGESWDVQIINDAKGEPFGSGAEGGSVSEVGLTATIELYSVLVLDQSDSIFNNGVEQDVLDGAEAFIRAVVETAPPEYRHKVAIIAFGRPELVELVQDFTDDASELLGVIEDLRTAPSRGTTDLYGAYIDALDLIDAQGSEDGVVERFVVLISDGTHEAGAEGQLRDIALSKKADSDSNKFTIGIKGAYDPCKLEELSGGPVTCAGELLGCRSGLSCDPNQPPPPSCTQFLADVDPSDLTAAFDAFAVRAQGIARSNYIVGVCTPVALGSSSLTISVNVDGAVDTATLEYRPSELGLNGAVNECDPEEVKDFEPEGTGGEGGGGTGGGGTGGGGTGGGGTGGGGQGGGGQGGAGGN